MAAATLKLVVPSVRASPESLLDEAARFALLRDGVNELRATFAAGRAVLTRARITLVSSTATGGGVAEMLHQIVPIARELGATIDWLVIEPRADLAPAFFDLTKRIHNALHGGDDAPVFTAADKTVFEAVNGAAARAVIARGHGRVDPAADVYVIHDPQPAGMIGALAATGCLTTWRCHIGSEGSSPAADAAWAFLAPYIEPADAAVFSLRAYVPAFLADRAFIHAPGIAPLSSKNTDLPLDEIVSILERAALVAAPLDEARDECGATDAPFLARASVYSGAATGWGAVSCACERGELLGAAGGRSIRRARSCATHAASVEAECANALCDLCTRLPRTVPLLWRPCITQVSRWDRLKGWRDLLSGFLALKSSHGAAAPWLAHAAGGKRAERDRAARTICNAALVLAGPDPSGVTDDPEGEEVMVLASHRCTHTILTTPDAHPEPKVLADLIAAFDALPPAASRDIFIVVLPMVSSEENALMVNALQRASAVLVQASSREGYGLTVGEARFKRKPVVVTEAAAGLRSQVVDGLDGILIRGRSDAGAPAPAAVAAALATALVNRAVRAAIAVNGESKTVRGGLIYNQISRWLGLLAAVLPAARGEERAEKIRALSRAVRAGEADEDASRAAAAAAAAAKAGSAAGA